LYNPYLAKASLEHRPQTFTVNSDVTVHFFIGLPLTSCVTQNWEIMLLRFLDMLVLLLH